MRAHPVFASPGIFGNRDAALAGELADGFGKTAVFLVLQEGDHIASLAAAKAIIRAAIGGHVEGRGLLVVEGTQSLPTPPAALRLQNDVLTDDFRDVGDEQQLRGREPGASRLSRFRTPARWILSGVGLKPPTTAPKRPLLCQ